MIEIPYLSIRQPIGEFYLCTIPASVLTKAVTVVSRKDNQLGIQRERSAERVKSISAFCSDPDAMFPTPIVVSVNKDAKVRLNENNRVISFPEDTIIGEVIDGQHRLWGIRESVNIDSFDLPVVMMFDLTTEEKAYVFSTINSNQTKVDPSLIYDLFDVSTYRSPQKTAHQIARTMNYNTESPFYNRLKMLGKKTKDQDLATLSQGTFAKSIIKLISRNVEDDARKLKNGQALLADEKLPLRSYFIDNKDDVLGKIILNCFVALKSVFPQEWLQPKQNILWKSTGFCAVIYALPSLCRQGLREQDLTVSYFENCFIQLRVLLKKENVKLTSESFPGGGEQNQKKLAALIVRAASMEKLEEYQNNIITLKSLQEYINCLDEPDKYELYDLVMALENGTASYGTVTINQEDDMLVLGCTYQDIQCVVPNEQRKKLVQFIESTYMDGMDAESWLGYQEILEKEKDE